MAHADPLETFSVDHVMLTQERVSMSSQLPETLQDLVVRPTARFWFAEGLFGTGVRGWSRDILIRALTHGFGVQVPVLVLGSMMVKNLSLRV